MTCNSHHICRDHHQTAIVRGARYGALRIYEVVHMPEGYPLPCREYLEIVVMQSPPERPVYLLGESFGGVLALAVAESRPDLVSANFW